MAGAMGAAIVRLPASPKSLHCWRKARCIDDASALSTLQPSRCGNEAMSVVSVPLLTSIRAARCSYHWMDGIAIESVPESETSWHRASCCRMRCAAIAGKWLRWLLVADLLGDTQNEHRWIGSVRAASVYLGKHCRFARFLYPMVMTV